MSGCGKYVVLNFLGIEGVGCMVLRSICLYGSVLLFYGLWCGVGNVVKVLWWEISSSWFDWCEVVCGL